MVRKLDHAAQLIIAAPDLAGSRLDRFQTGGQNREVLRHHELDCLLRETQFGYRES
jgi:hypothetical protein